MPKPPILRTALSFGLSAPAAVVSTLSFVAGHPLPGSLWAFTSICWFVSGVFGLQTLKVLIRVAEIRGEVTALEGAKARREEWSR